MKKAVSDRLIRECVLENEEFCGITRDEAMTMASIDLQIPFQFIVDAMAEASE